LANTVLEEKIPESYIEETRENILVKYNFFNGEFQFNVGDYNTSQTLVVDPKPWATYYGGNEQEYGVDIITDYLDNIIVVGYTSSINNIATSGSHEIDYGNFEDAFIVKFNSLGVRDWGTYYGSDKFDRGTGV